MCVSHSLDFLAVRFGVKDVKWFVKVMHIYAWIYVSLFLNMPGKCTFSDRWLKDPNTKAGWREEEESVRQDALCASRHSVLKVWGNLP